MTISFCRYRLEGRTVSRTTEGALIRMNFDDGVGYGCLHPITEWGDPPLDQFLGELDRGESTSPINRALHFVRMDHMARAKKESLFKEEVSSFENHYLILRDQLEETLSNSETLKKIAQEGFKILKVKVPPDVWKAVEVVEKIVLQGLKIRLDFGSRFQEKPFIEFLERCKEYLPHIDYIEDPFPFDVDAWSAIQSRYPISLALDQGSERAVGLVRAAKVLVVKPSRQNELDFFFALAHGQRIVVTSLLDHPIGQLSAAFAASKFVQETHGIFSHRLYKETPFSALLEGAAPHLHYPGGMGFGYDALLQSLPWTVL